MTKLKKTRIGLYASLSVSVLVVMVAIGMTVSAYNGQNNGTVMENVTIETFNEASETPAEPLGAMSSPDIPYHYLSVNGDTIWHIKGSMINASTTLVSIDPTDYGMVASGTVVDKVRIRIDGVSTSTGLITCGAATADSGTAPTYDLMTTGTIATSTDLNCVMENGLLTADNGNSACADGGSISKIALSGSYPYFVCIVSGDITAGFTNANNTWDGEFLVQFNQMR